jgi:hypothetical protein
MSQVNHLIQSGTEKIVSHRVSPGQFLSGFYYFYFNSAGFNQGHFLAIALSVLVSGFCMADFIVLPAGNLKKTAPSKSGTITHQITMRYTGRAIVHVVSFGCYFTGTGRHVVGSVDTHPVFWIGQDFIGAFAIEQISTICNSRIVFREQRGLPSNLVRKAGACGRRA